VKEVCIVCQKTVCKKGKTGREMFVVGRPSMEVKTAIQACGMFQAIALLGLSRELSYGDTVIYRRSDEYDREVYPQT